MSLQTRTIGLQPAYPLHDSVSLALRVRGRGIARPGSASLPLQCDPRMVGPLCSAQPQATHSSSIAETSSSFLKTAASSGQRCPDRATLQRSTQASLHSKSSLSSHTCSLQAYLQRPAVLTFYHLAPSSYLPGPPPPDPKGGVRPGLPTPCRFPAVCPAPPSTKGRAPEGRAGES